MTELVLQPTTTAHWHSLLMEAQGQCAHALSEPLESYLVFLLMRYTENVEIAQSVLAIEYLESHQLRSGSMQKHSLQQVGDKCLLFSGLFPERAERKLVSCEYFIAMGQGAYLSLADLQLENLGELFQGLSAHFLTLTQVLRATRKISQQQENTAWANILAADFAGKDKQHN